MERKHKLRPVAGGMELTGVKSGHCLFIEKVERWDIPKALENDRGFTTWYRVSNWDQKGPVFFYMAKGYAAAPHQICVWYRNTGKMWSGYGKTFGDAIEGAQRDGWLCA